MSARFDLTKLPIPLVQFLAQHPAVAVFLDECPEFRAHLVHDSDSGWSGITGAAIEAFATWCEGNGLVTPEGAQDLREKVRTAERSARYERN